MREEHKASEIADDGEIVIITCECGFRAEGFDYTEAGKELDRHIEEEEF